MYDMRSSIVAYLMGLVSGIFCVMIVIYQRPSVDMVVKQFKPVIEVVDDHFDDFMNGEFEFPDVVLAQFCEETRFGQSVIFKENGNGFGMKHSKDGLSKGIRRGHADYGGDFSKSIEAYKRFQRKHLAAYRRVTGKEVKTNEEYIQFLGDLRKPWRVDATGAPDKTSYRYAANPDYEKHIRKLLKLVEKAKQLSLEEQSQAKS